MSNYIGVERAQPKFTIVNNWVIGDRGEIFKTIYEKQLYISLMFFADNSTKESFPSIQTLSEMCLCSERTIQRTLQELEKRKLIQVTRRIAEDNRNYTNVYKLLEPVMVSQSHQVVTESHHGGDRESPELYLLELDSINYINNTSASYNKTKKTKPQNDKRTSISSTGNEFRKIVNITPPERILGNAPLTEMDTSVTEHERNILNTFAKIERYPLDYAKDLEHIRQLAEDFPTLDLYQQAKKWLTYKLDKPLQENSNARSQFRTWCQKAVEFKNVNHFKMSKLAQQREEMEALRQKILREEEEEEHEKVRSL